MTEMRDIGELIAKKVSLEFVDTDRNHAKTIEYDLIDNLSWDREMNVDHNANGMILVDGHTITLKFDVDPRSISSHEEDEE